MKKLLSCIVLAVTIVFPLRASADEARICTRERGSKVTLRVGPGLKHRRGLVEVGSGGFRVDNYFRQRNYTVQDGEEVTIGSKVEAKDGVWYEVGTNQWVAWVRSDFVCQSPSAPNSSSR